LHRRVFSFFSELNSLHNFDDKILIVTHGGVIRVLLSVIESKNLSKFWRYDIKNLFELDFKETDLDTFLSAKTINE